MDKEMYGITAHEAEKAPELSGGMNGEADM